MHIQVTLNLIAYVLVMVGILLAGIRLYNPDHEISGCRYALTLGWLCAIAGVIILIVTLYTSVEWQNLLHEVAYSIVLAGVLMSCPLLACHENICHHSMVNCRLISWLSFTAALILLVVPVYLSVSLQHVLSTIAYGLFIYGVLLLSLKLFRSVIGAVTAVCLLAGFILLLVALYQ